jgi:hypothetical protein
VVVLAGYLRSQRIVRVSRHVPSLPSAATAAAVCRRRKGRGSPSQRERYLLIPRGETQSPVECILYILYIVYCILYIQLNIVLYIVHCILYIIYCILYIVYCILYIVYYILYIVYCILYIVYCTFN